MACPSLLRGVVLRATRLDACGRPVYGDCNQVVSDGFITVSMSSETEEGEAISVTKANGQTCISEAGCEQLSHYTTEIQFCEIDPDLVQVMNPNFEIYRDAEGHAIGWDDSVELRCDSGFALEVWTNVYASADACSGAGSQGQWGYLLLPWVIGGASGDLEVGNDAVTFTFNGRTKVGAGWRKGPYAVQAGEGGVPGPMLKPIGPKTPRRFFVTTIAPPEPECGCQPVDRPVPDPADLLITGIANESSRRTVRMRVDNHGFGPTMVDWGDGTQPQEVPDGATVSHAYASDGDYTVTVRDKQTPAVLVQRKVTVPLPADEPTVELSCGDADNAFQITAHITMPSQSNGEASVDWGDGSDREQVTASADATVSVLHLYSVPGIYPVTARRTEAETFRARDAIQVPCVQGPKLTIAEDTSDTTRMTVLLTVDNHGQGPVSIDWGDATTGQAQDGGTVSHQYANPGDYNVMATSVANPAARSQATVTVPFGDSGSGPSVTAEADPSDATGRTVVLHINNTGSGGTPGQGPRATAAADPSDVTGRTVMLNVDNT